MKKDKAPLVRLAKVVVGAAREQANRAELAARTNKQAAGAPIAIFAGNSSALAQVTQVLTPVVEVRGVPNLRPSLTMEQTGPTEEMLAIGLKLQNAGTALSFRSPLRI